MKGGQGLQVLAAALCSSAGVQGGDGVEVLIVSGFLGAGKTTFIRRLTGRVRRNFAVLENEFGQTDIDARIIGGNSDLSVYEMSENCVCCTGKTDFLSTLLAISNSLDPDYLVVEPTGIARLGNIIQNIENLGYGRISVLPPVVIVDAGTFLRERDRLDSIYLNQIGNAKTIVLSKSEGLDEDELEPYRVALRELNAGAELVVGDYRERPQDWWEGLLERGAGARAGAGGVRVGADGACADGGAGSGAEKAAGKRLEQPMESVTFSGVALPTPVHLMMILDVTVAGLFGGIVRAKGYLPCGHEWIRFDLVDRKWAITGMDAPVPDGPGQGGGSGPEGLAAQGGGSGPEGRSHSACTFIGRYIDRESLDRYFSLFDDENGGSIAEGGRPAAAPARRYRSPRPF